MRPIPSSVCIIAALALLPGAGCSQETAKRTSFETLQILRDQECRRDLSGSCPPRESYEAYTRKRREALDEASRPASP